MKTKDIYIEEEVNQRLDKFLSEKIPGRSRSYIKKLIKDGFVLVNNKVEKPRYTLVKGDQIKVKLKDYDKIELKPQNLPINILYEDQYLAVISKPAGMVVHPAKGNESYTLVNALLYHMGKLSFMNEGLRPGIVHRLDKDTSGLLIIAKDNYTHKLLVEDFKKRVVERRYLALVHNQISKDRGKIDAPIGRNPKNRKTMAVICKNSKKAVTYYKVLERYNKFSLIEASLETGRTHQIRVHLSYINHPILGDPLYCKFENTFNIKRQMLHSSHIGFNHPIKKRYMTFDLKPPEDFRELLKKLKSKVM